MTENKRFKLAYKEGDWWAVRDGEITLWKEEVIHLLNKLHEDNEELKERVKQLQIDNTVIKKRYDTLIHEQLQNKKNYLHNKPQVWFTQDIILKDKELDKVAEAIEQDLKERGIKND